MSAGRAFALASAVAGLALATSWAARPSAQAAPAPDARLTVADIERVSGLTGVRLVAKNSLPGAGGQLNFAGPEGRLLLIANFVSAQLYEGSKKSSITFHAAFSGLGDDAFDGPAGASQYCIYVRKGTKAFSLATFMDTKAKPMAFRLTLDQLKKLGALVVPRI